MAMNLGKRIAPPRFLLFLAVLVIGLIVAIPPLGWGRGTMAAFDVASAVFLIAILPLLRGGNAKSMRKAAQDNDANRTGLLAITGVTMVVILVSVAKELQAKDQHDLWSVALVVVTLILAWLFSNIIYALHYAHLYYSDCDGDGKDTGGLDIPDCKEPDYWDFIYFSFTLGMTFQTSDIEINSRRMRMVTLGQCLAAFVFNLGILAFTINTLGGG
ncbi:MAG: DUF1345 domain-containing protein [Sphingomonas sp.]|uniref:DUF1345 domain-containing protein n=1 Tax=Sphingomonas sp. TaxID=28214 RepID=UPI001ACA3ED0|nr:DUF1345 domain-containing protein [Sphingomonas sp.]MBN8816693.1 DUF1345 domain-containing protein [Sphingomonas sp.]